MSNLFTIPKAASRLGIPKADVIALINNGVLECISTGSKQFIKPQGIFNLIGTPAEITSKKDGYPASEELSSVLPNGNDNADGDEMEEYKKYRGSITHDKAHNRFVVQVRDRATRKAVHNNGTFKDRLSAEQYLQRKLFEMNAKAYATEHGFAPAEPQQTPTVLPQEVASIVTYPKITLNEFGLSYLNTRQTTKRTSRTMEGYRIGLAMVKDTLGKKYMYAITLSDVETTFAHMAFKYKQSSLDRCYIILRRLFDIASKGDRSRQLTPIIPFNPLEEWEKPQTMVVAEADANKLPPVFSDADIDLLFKTSKAFNFELYVMFTVLECTGMRPGEMRALTWSAYHPEEKYISVYQAATVDYGSNFTTIAKTAKGKLALGPTKNRKSRQVPLSDTAIEALTEWRALLDKRKNPYKKDSPYIFPNRQGKMKSDSGCSSIVQRYREAYGLQEMGVNLYKFRHTLCTRLLLEDYSFLVVKTILGDASVEVIEKYYTHLKEAQALEKIKGFYKRRYDSQGIKRVQEQMLKNGEEQ